MPVVHVMCILAATAWAQSQVEPGQNSKVASGGLIRELMHPSNTGSIHGVRFSQDGTKLIAGDYPGGVVVVWDVASGKQLVKIETGHGYRGSAEYFSVSPDWKTLFVSRHKRESKRIEVDGTSYAVILLSVPTANGWRSSRN